MKTDVFLNVSDHVHLQRLGPHDGPSYVTLARSCTYISDTAVTSRVYILLTTVHMTTTTGSPQERAKSFWSRRSRAGPSLSTRTKRPATSEGAREHDMQASQRARPAAKKSGSRVSAIRQPSAATLAGKRAPRRVECWGQHPHASAHLHTLRALLVLTAAGACRLRSSDRGHVVHDNAAIRTLLVEGSGWR